MCSRQQQRIRIVLYFLPVDAVKVLEQHSLSEAHRDPCLSFTRCPNMARVEDRRLRHLIDEHPASQPYLEIG